MKTRLITVGSVLVAMASGFAQGFVNLDFEESTIVPDRSSVYYPDAVYVSNAVPGWSAYVSGVPQRDLLFNTVPLGNPWVTIQGPGSHYPSVSGQYFMFLFGQYNPNHNATSTNSSAIGQTGQIPPTAQSLTYWGSYPTIGVTFKGQPLGFEVLRSSPNYTVFGADISAFAGQTGELRFTAPYNTAAEIDNIQFSSQPIPEPGSLAWLGAGVWLVARYSQRKPR